MSNLNNLERNYKISVAKKLKSVNAAIFIHNIAYWIKKNLANRKHIHDNKCYTYNTINAFCELFEEFTKSQIETILKNLKDMKIIEVRKDLNKIAYDRTSWYTIIDNEILELYNIDYTVLNNTISENSEMVNGEIGNVISEKSDDDTKPNTKPSYPNLPNAKGRLVGLRDLISQYCDYHYDYDKLEKFIRDELTKNKDNINNINRYTIKLIEKYKENFRIIKKDSYNNYEKVIERETNYNTCDYEDIKDELEKMKKNLLNNFNINKKIK